MSRPEPRDRDNRPAGPHRSLWLREALGGEADQPPLSGDAAADVTIVGGGYVGLWTALEIRRADPGCDVLLIERDVCGSGASGRNGGQLHSWWDRVDTLAVVCGEAEAVRLADASKEAIEVIAALESEHSQDVGLRRDGWLWTASTAAQQGAWQGVLEACERRGAEPYELLTRDEVVARTGSPVLLGGVIERGSGTVHPGKLVRALRRLALAAGVRIHEHTRMTGLDRGTPPRVLTDGGVITSRRVVLATNAWAAGLRELRSQLLVVSSEIVATEPAPERLASIGWTGGEAICDSQARVLYYQATADGRVVFGRGGGSMSPVARYLPRRDPGSRWMDDATQAFRRLYPQLAAVEVRDGWSGPIDRSFTHLPMFGHLGGHSDILYGVGWSGTGVGPSVLGGRILASLALGREDEWSSSALVDQPEFGRFPPEPIRSAGGALVRRAVIARGRAEDEGRRPPRLVKLLSEQVPGLER